MFFTGDSKDYIYDIDLRLYCKTEGICLSEIKKAALAHKKQNSIIKLFHILFM